MPKMSGDEILRKARRKHPHLPGIIISGYPESRATMKDLGDVVVLAKPFTLEQMGKAIREGRCQRRVRASPTG